MGTGELAERLVDAVRSFGDRRRWVAGLALATVAVVLYLVFRANGPGELVGSGTIEGDKVVISSEIPGLIKDIPVQEGDQVKEGESLIMIDASQSKYRQVSRDWDRYQKLYSEGAVSDAEYLEARAGYEMAGANRDLAQKQVKQAERGLAQAKAGLLQASVQDKTVQGTKAQAEQAVSAHNAAQSQVKAAEAVLKEAQILLAKADLKAPTGGVVITRMAQKGEMAAPGTPVMELVNLDRLYLTIYLPEKDLGRVKLGQEARVRIDSFPDRPLSGKVVQIAQEAEFTPKNVHMPEERIKLVYGIKIAVENKDGVLKLGMPADAEIIDD